MAVTRQLQRQVLTAYIKDVKSPNTVGGALSNNTAFFARVINTLSGDTSFIALASGTTGTDGTATQFTLQPGEYNINIRCAFGLTNGSDPQVTKVRLFNVTDTITALVGDSGRLGDADVSLTASFSMGIAGRVNITAAKTFEIQVRCGGVVGNTQMLGIPANFVENEVYTSATIDKLA